MLKTLKRLVSRFRSAVSGRFVTEGYARRHPETTVKEKD